MYVRRALICSQGSGPEGTMIWFWIFGQVAFSAPYAVRPYRPTVVESNNKMEADRVLGLWEVHLTDNL